MSDAVHIEHHEGWVGAFSRNEAEGAIPNGAAVLKVNSEPGDGHPDGSVGIVVGSLDVGDLDTSGLPAGMPKVKFLYWIEWKSRPRHAVGIIDHKVRRA